MAALVDAREVRTHLRRYDVTDAEVGIACDLVAGWLREDAERDVLRQPLPKSDPLWASAFELVVLAVTNPGSIASTTRGPTSTTWPITARRDAIREGVRQRTAQAATRPRGNFPPASAYPDAAMPYGWLPGQMGRPW